MPWDLDVAAIWAETGTLAAGDAADAEDLARRGLLGELAAADAGIRGRRGPVERWPEDSGNAALVGRELPAAQVLAADQRITWWARQLKAAGLEGNMDELRARAYLDLLLDADSRPAASASPAAEEEGGSVPPRTPPGSGVIPAGFTGRTHLTVPLATLLDLADRPSEIPA